MLEIFNEIFVLLNAPHNSLIVWIVFLAVGLVALLLRVVLCVGYQAQFALLALSVKDVAKPADIKDGRSALLNRVTKDYIKAAGKGSIGLDARSFAEKHVRRLAFLGWNYESMARFLQAVTAWILPCGVLLALVFEEYRLAYALAALGAYTLTRLLENVFDFILVKEKLLDETTEYVNREIGQFYSRDLNAVVSLLRDEVSKSIEKTVAGLADVNAALAEPIAMWQNSLAQAAQTQEALNATCAALHGALTASKTLAEQAGAADMENSALQKQLAYIEKNQAVLESSLHKYEQSLEGLTRKISEGFGGMTDYYMQNAAGALNAGLEANISTIVSSNNEMMRRLSALFEDMQTRQKSEMQAILNMVSREV